MPEKDHFRSYVWQGHRKLDVGGHAGYGDWGVGPCHLLRRCCNPSVVLLHESHLMTLDLSIPALSLVTSHQLYLQSLPPPSLLYLL